jgi:hypothetical protein
LLSLLGIWKLLTEERDQTYLVLSQFLAIELKQAYLTERSLAFVFLLYFEKKRGWQPVKKKYEEWPSALV